MSTIKIKSMKTIPTSILSNKLSYLRCMKYDNTKKPLTPAINKANVTVNDTRLNEVTLMVKKVRNMSTTNTLYNTLYSVVCELLLAILNFILRN